jgi:nucleotide-binding universal stress UspA family protein
MATLTHVPLPSTQSHLSFKKLLVAYDFSPYADIALEYALDLAVKQSAEITLLHAVRSLETDASSIPERDLDVALNKCRSLRITARTLSRTGPAGAVIAEAVAEIKPDVLFLGAYGNDRQDRKVLGSTAELLLRILPCPIAVVGPKAIKQPPTPDGSEKIICPVDFPEDVHERLSMIARFARALRADVQLVHAVDVYHELSRPHSATDTQFEFEMLAAHLLHEGVAAEATLLYGIPEEVIAELAARAKANYILFGMHKDGNFSSFFRKSLVARVIKLAPCAVFAFPQPGEASAGSGDH